MNAPKEHWLHRQAEPAWVLERHMKASAGKSTPENPLFAHTLERSWSMLFNCALGVSLARNEGREGVCNKAECWCRDLPEDEGLMADDRGGGQEVVLNEEGKRQGSGYDDGVWGNNEVEVRDWEKIHSILE